MSDKKIILSGIQPSGAITLGNYLGAVSNWVKLQNDPESQYECYYMVADLHALTVRQEAKVLRKRVLDTYALLIACGLDPEKTMVFIQSQVPAHAELSWILSCYTQFGELSRMTQFKDKAQKHKDNVNAGLFTYPVLMAADILLYQADLVPVGIDQKQHLELARDIAIRFNNAYSPTFKVPEPFTVKETSKIMSLTDPTKKMSKSDTNENSTIAILDDRDAIIRKFKRAVTDSFAEIRFAPGEEGREGVTNLLSIYSAVTGKDMDACVSEFSGKGYGDLKLAVGEAVSDALAPVRERFAEVSSDKAYLEKMYTQNSERAKYLSNKTLSKVYRKVGLIR
ncbi:MAG: tryptophan--tRNA ligase [Clostridia bacterium]|nr:tryptophan--tRNA ligase [Clostridia bacterium]MBQ1435067.1 tryptophan--tRNA ligase [Clostridia bacterium]